MRRGAARWLLTAVLLSTLVGVIATLRERGRAGDLGFRIALSAQVVLVCVLLALAATQAWSRGAHAASVLAVVTLAVAGALSVVGILEGRYDATHWILTLAAWAVAFMVSYACGLAVIGVRRSDVIGIAAFAVVAIACMIVAFRVEGAPLLVAGTLGLGLTAVLVLRARTDPEPAESAGSGRCPTCGRGP